MLHTKLLMQRLVCVPWLLAASLALGWAGEAAAQADLKLSVNPASVREDAGETDVEVTVQVADDTAVDADTSVLLSVSTEGLNTRFRIELTTLRIPAGEKKATGILTFTPINDDIIDEDLPIDISGNAGSDKTVESATITLIDDDKDSQNIDLSVDIAELTRFDDATDITVTATLDGKVLNEDTSFSLVIGNHPNLTSDPNTDTDDDGDMDEADATKDNREALRDVDYTVTLATLTISRRSVSGTATITITPKKQLPGTIRLESPDKDTDAAGIQIADDGLTLNPVDIALKKEVAATADAITLSQERVREDAGETVIELTVTLTEVLVGDETVNLSVLSAGDVLPSGDTVTETPLRDVHYKLIFGESLTIPAGATEGTTTFTITPKNDTDAAQRGTIYIQIRVGDVLATRTIVLVDDDSNSMNIWLTAAPAAISEGAGTTDVIVTGTLDGKVFDSDVVMLLTIDADINGDGVVNDDDEAAMRDVDYSATVRSLTIPADAASGTTTFTITPTDDKTVEADETIRLTVPDANNQITAQYADEEDVTLTVSTVDITLQDTGVGGAPSFATDAAIADQTYAVGTAIADLVLPEASDGDAPLIYSVSALPAGLEFDADTRTLAGTPTAATDGALAVTYTVTDSGDDTATLIFSITVTVNSALAAEVAAAGLTAVPAAIREDAAATAVSLTFTLEAASTADESVRFVIVAPSEGTEAVRDVDYTVVLEALITIPAGTTEGTATLTITPINDDAEEGLKALGVQATLVSTGAVLSTDITITDDETPSTAIELSADPSTLDENAGLITITVTATLDGKALDEDATVRVTIDNESTAQRDLDYSALFTPVIEIPAGSITGTMDFSILPVADDVEEGDEVIRLIGTIDGLEGDEVEITISDPGAAKAVVQTRPEAFSLADNFPNPFNPATTIQYALPQAADVELTVYNVVGQPVRTLVAEYQSAGRYAVEWDATNDRGHSLSSGMYFYRLQAAGQFREVKKMLLLK